MIFGKYINRYYLKNAPVLLLGLAALLTVDYIQLLIPRLYRLVINGVNLGQVVVDGQTVAFGKEVLFQHICLPMIYIIILMVLGRFLWRVCFFGSAVRVTADLRERMFDHSRQLSQQYYQVNKVGNLMSLYTNDLDTIQECFGDGVLMFFDALTLGLLALYKMWNMDHQLTLLALIPALLMLAIGTVMGKTMTKTWEKRQQAFSDLSDFAQENFSGIAVIKAFVKELKELIAFRKLNKENEKINVEYTRISVLLEIMVTLFVDGKDVNTVSIHSVRNACAYVPQDNFLFSDTIAHNIGFGVDDATREDIDRAAALADVRDNIVDFKDGYETVLGERGVTVSGGQKQRISIARALLKNAPILILDDSVSAVDTRTEKIILDNLKASRAGKTTLLIAHRISTVEGLDKIIFLEDGRVEAVGPHDSLYASCPEYRRMVDLQRLEDEVGGDSNG